MRQLQLVFKSGERPFPEILMDASVSRKSRIIYRGHIGFLIRKMLNGMILKVFYGLLAGKMAFFFCVSKVKQLVENAEELLVLFVDNVHSYIIIVLPYQTASHIFPPSCLCPAGFAVRRPMFRHGVLKYNFY